MTEAPLFPRDLPGSFSFQPRSYRTESPAWLPYLPFAHDVVAWLRPKLIVELGTHWGNAYFTMCQSNRENKIGATCHAVDTWQNNAYAGDNAQEAYNYVSQHNETHYRDFSHLFRTTCDKAVEQFQDGTIGLLHIDGYHTYEAALHDFETWMPKVAEGGIILLHNTQLRKGGYGVWKLWAELVKKHRSFSFNQENGLGVLLKGTNLEGLPPPLRQLFEAGLSESDGIRAYYARCAECISGAFSQRRIAELEDECERLQAEMGRIPSLEAEAREGALAKYELRKIKAGALWFVTGPLRDARKAWDKMRKIKPGTHRPHVKEFVHYFDRPRDWKSLKDEGLIEGWVYSSLGTPIHGVRARGAGQIWVARMNVVRTDVGPRHVMAGKSCGFEIGYKLSGVEKFTMYFDALLPDGTWFQFGRRNVCMRLSEAAAYARWLKANERVNPPLPPPQKGPTISVLMPAHNTPEKWLRKALESVKTQTYTGWQLCIADDASTEAHVRKVVEAYASRDPRITAVYHKTGGKIAAALNSALEMATGEFITVLNPCDELMPQALAEVARVLSVHPQTELVYSDEDKIGKNGSRIEPALKPDWSPDLLDARHYTGHLSVYRTASVRAAGGFRTGYEGAHEWDLALRVLGDTGKQQVIHIPHVLYHERDLSLPQEATPDGTVPRLKVERKALREHLERNRINAEVVLADGGWRVLHALPAVAPRVSIIIPTRNMVALLRTCVTSLLNRTTYKDFEIIIVDNGSDELETLKYFEEIKRQGVKILRDDRPFNYSQLNNFAVEHATGKILAFLNNDIEVITPGWLEEMAGHAQRQEIGAVGAMLYYPDNHIQHAGVVLGIGGIAGHAMKHLKRGETGYLHGLSVVQNYSAVTGACLVIRRNVFEEVRGFNEKDLAVAFNDVDFCLRVRAKGYRNLWTPFAELYHHESASRGADDTAEKQKRFAKEIAHMRKQWADVLDHDPGYNANLARDREEFVLAWPPNAIPKDIGRDVFLEQNKA